MKPSVVSTVPPPCHWMEWNPTFWNPTHCAPAVGDGSNASSRSLTQARLFNWFCLQFSSFLLPCGGIAYFVKQDNLRLHWQLPNSLLKPTDLFLTNFSAYSIQQNPHQWMRKQESLTAFNNIFLFQPSIFWVLLLQLLDFCLVLLFGEQDYFWAEPISTCGATLHFSPTCKQHFTGRESSIQKSQRVFHRFRNCLWRAPQYPKRPSYGDAHICIFVRKWHWNELLSSKSFSHDLTGIVKNACMCTASVYPQQIKKPAIFHISLSYSFLPILQHFLFFNLQALLVGKVFFCS